MTEFAFQFGVSNLLVSSVLALLAWVVQRSGQRPMLAHLLWLLVLAKLLTPPMFTVPLLEVGPEVSSSATSPWGTDADDVASIRALGAIGAADAALPSEPAESVAEPEAVSWVFWLGWAWLLGSAVVLTASLVRIVRFDRLLRASSTPAPDVLQRQAEILGRRLGLGRIPTVHITEARISPMVWWAFGSCGIYVPEGLPEELGSARTRWVLAHELAHVRRRDHLVRWLEWLACVAFWWNPITWWARRNLRVHEELCCDALVMGALRPKPQTYATSLLGVLEFLSASVLRPPALASEARGGFLERRFHMILNSQNARPVRRLHALAVLAAAVFLPLGIAYAQDPNYDAVAERLVKAVKAGELSVQQAESMMGELARARFREHLGSRPFGFTSFGLSELRDTDGDGLPDTRLPSSKGRRSGADAVDTARRRSRWSTETDEEKKRAETAETLRRKLLEKTRQVQATEKLKKKVEEQYRLKLEEFRRRAAEAEVRARDARDRAAEQKDRREAERRDSVRRRTDRREGERRDSGRRRTDRRVSGLGDARRTAGADSTRKAADLLRLREMSARIDEARRAGDLSGSDAKEKLEELRRSVEKIREARDKADAVRGRRRTGRNPTDRRLPPSRSSTDRQLPPDRRSGDVRTPFDRLDAAEQEAVRRAVEKAPAAEKKPANPFEELRRRAAENAEKRDRAVRDTARRGTSDRPVDTRAVEHLRNAVERARRSAENRRRSKETEAVDRRARTEALRKEEEWKLSTVRFGRFETPPVVR